MMTALKRKVVIVGAGIAGLSAGAELCRSGHCDVIILEAMPTCGGRIQTLKGFGSHSIELGANWLHGTKGSPVYDIAKKHGLLKISGRTKSPTSISFSSPSSPSPFISYSMSSSFSSSSMSPSIIDEADDAKWWMNNSAAENQYRLETGELLDTNIVLRAKKMFADAQIKTIDECDLSGVDASQSVDDALRAGFAHEMEQEGINCGNQEYDKFWLLYEQCCRMECLDIGANSLRDAQLRSYNCYLELGGYYYTVLGNHGYQGVLDKLLEDIPKGSIYYNTPVAQIQYAGCCTLQNDVSKDDDKDDSVVMVTCEDGRTFNCNHVIVTASVGFLKENLETFFKPPLPEDKVRILNILTYGNVNKIFLKYEKPFWNSPDFGLQTLWRPPLPDVEALDFEEEKEKFYRMLPGFDVENKNDDILVGWVYGKGADYMETLSDEEIGQHCTSILRKFLNDPFLPEPEKILCTRWHGNRFQRGAYGAFLPLCAGDRDFEAINRPVYSKKTRHGQPIPVLLFAGEAFHEHYYSTTHGAMFSGQDQARVLIDFFSSAEL